MVDCLQCSPLPGTISLITRRRRASWGSQPVARVSARWHRRRSLPQSHRPWQWLILPVSQWKPDGERNEHGADPSASASRSRSVTRRGWGSDWPSESGHRDGSPQILRWVVMRHAIEAWRRCLSGQGDRVVRRPPEERTNRQQLRVNRRGFGPDLSDQLFLAWHGCEPGRYAIQCSSGCKTFSC